MIKKIIRIGILFVSYKYIIKRFFQPKTSVFPTTHNKQDYIRNAINSIQKQTLKDIEIVTVNDYSNDNSYNILKELALKGKRIKIINTTKNFGLFYSRAMGILHSSEEYPINLDPDDEFNDSDNLEFLLRIAM